MTQKYKVRPAKHNPRMFEVYVDDRQGIVYFTERGDAERFCKMMNNECKELLS